MNALGSTINIPVPPGATGDVVRRAIDDVATPSIAAFEPTWVLVSAGFDSHRDDPMADLALTSGDFAAMARTIARFAPRAGRFAMFLEGGYELNALRTSVAASLAAVLESPYSAEAESFGGPGAQQVQSAREERLVALRIAEEAATQGDYS